MVPVQAIPGPRRLGGPNCGAMGWFDRSSNNAKLKAANTDYDQQPDGDSWAATVPSKHCPARQSHHRTDSKLRQKRPVSPADIFWLEEKRSGKKKMPRKKPVKKRRTFWQRLDTVEMRASVTWAVGHEGHAGIRGNDTCG